MARRSLYGVAEGLMTLSRRLRKNFTWLLAPAAALILLQSTRGVAELVGARFGPDPAALAADLTSHRRHHGEPAFHATSAASILAHNPFDSQAPPHDEEAPAEIVEASDDPMDAPACDGVRVLGIVSSADPEWSLAAFEESAAPPSPARSVLRRRGGEVGDRRVEFIAWDRVWMASARGRCQAAMFSPRSSAADPAAEPGRSLARPGVSSSTPALEPWIRKGIETVSPTERRIDRAIVPRLLEKQAELIKPAQAFPEVMNGKIVGYRLTGVRPDSFLGALGIADGDRIRSINGYDLTDTQSAIEAYAHLLQADHLVLQVTRGGADVRLQLDIR